MSRLNTFTTLVSAGYPAWYSFGVSRGILDVSSGLQTQLRVPTSGATPLFDKLIENLKQDLNYEWEVEPIIKEIRKVQKFIVCETMLEEIKRMNKQNVDKYEITMDEGDRQFHTPGDDSDYYRKQTKKKNKDLEKKLKILTQEINEQIVYIYVTGTENVKIDNTRKKIIHGLIEETLIQKLQKGKVPVFIKETKRKQRKENIYNILREVLKKYKSDIKPEFFEELNVQLNFSKFFKSREIGTLRSDIKQAHPGV